MLQFLNAYINPHFQAFCDPAFELLRNERGNDFCSNQDQHLTELFIAPLAIGLTALSAYCLYKAATRVRQPAAHALVLPLPEFDQHEDELPAALPMLFQEAMPPAAIEPVVEATPVPARLR